MTVKRQTVILENPISWKGKILWWWLQWRDRSGTQKKPIDMYRMNVVIAGAVTLIVLRA
jgi:hypothetical protein